MAANTLRSARFRGRSLLIAFAVVVVCFLTATFVAQRTLRRIDDASDALAEGSMPSTEQLQTILAGVREVELRVSELNSAPAARKADRRNDLLRARRRLDDIVNNYFSQTTYPGEQDYWPALRSSLEQLDRALDRVLDLSDRGRDDAARGAAQMTLRPAANRAIEAVTAVSRFDAQTGNDLAVEIKRTRRSAALLGYGLDLLCALVAMTAGVLVFGQLRRHHLLREEHARLLEDRSRELEAFAGRVAHDIINPLAAARLAIELVRARTSDPKARRLSEQSLGSFARAEAIIHDLLAFARAGGRPEPGTLADVAEVIPGVVGDLRHAAREAGIELTVEPIHRARVSCTRGVLESLVGNLVRNAVKFTADSPERRVTVRAMMTLGETVRVEVEDTGPGVDPSLAGRLFQPFQRADGATQPGIGLGLATAKRLAEAHGGTIGVRSSARGSLFWFTMPCSPSVSVQPSSWFRRMVDQLRRGGGGTAIKRA
jgi:signal transduction histidine kinase